MIANGTLLEMHAREIAGMPETWRVSNFDTIREDGRILEHELTGAVVPTVPGGSKVLWHRKDHATERVVRFTPAEHEAWLRAWEARTGLCRWCVGSGSVIGSLIPVTYCGCPACSGSGSCRGRVA